MSAMLELIGLAEIRAEVLRLAQHKLKNLIVDARVENDTDTDGRDSLRITLILKSQRALASRGNELGELTLAVGDMLSKQGDSRFPFFRFATRGELKELERGDD
jgi:hypothetical protein